MIKHILKIVWNQRRANGWIFAELLVVVGVLWVTIDSLLVDTFTYYSPLGFDIENTYKVDLGVLTPETPGYIDDSLLTTQKGEDVMRLVENLRQVSEVEAVCLSSVGCPYTYNNSWGELIRSDADSLVKAESYQQSNVTSEYFDVLRITDKEGKPLSSVVGKNRGMVVSADLERRFFGNESAKGKSVKFNIHNTDEIPILAVSDPIRQDEFVKSEPLFYQVVSESEMIGLIEYRCPQGIDCLIRMKSGFRPENMESFLQGMRDRLMINNVYVTSVTPLSLYRDTILKDRQDKMKKKAALVGFMLVNVFFGIIGTFWLRTQSRQGELGLRIALGSNRSQLSRLMNLEGLCLLVLTIPFVLLFILNMLYFDMLDTYREPYTWWRFAVTLGGTYLLMGGMICVGIWLPIRKAMKMKPAEALHYE